MQPYRGCEIKGLESRMLFSACDLSSSVMRVSLPATVVGGSTVHGSAVVHVCNGGAGAAARGTTVELFVSPDGTWANAMVLGTRSVTTAINPSKSANITVLISSIPNLAYGDCTILATTIDAAGNETSSTPFARTFAIVAPFVGITATATSVHPNIFGIKPHAFSGTVTVFNTGNEAATGTLTVIADGYNDAYPVGSIGPNVYQFTNTSIKAGRSRKFAVRDEYLGQSTVPIGTFSLGLSITIDAVTTEIIAPGTYSVT